jgi:hypothetical protein
MPKIIHGETIEDKFTSLELVLCSFQRRLSTKVIGLLPPVVIMHRQLMPDAGGTFFKGVLPLHGNIVRLCLNVGLASKLGSPCHIHHYNGNVETIANKPIAKHTEIYTLDMSVQPGDVIELSTDVSAELHDIMFGLLLVPAVVGQMRQEHFLLDQLLQLEAKEDA